MPKKDNRIKIKNKDEFIEEYIKYKVNNKNKLTLQTLADKFKVTKERIRQLASEHSVEINKKFQEAISE